MSPTQSISISKIASDDNQPIRQIIKQVGQEFGAIGEGFGPSDPEVEEMSKYYLDEQRSAYFVARLNDKIVGGGGIAPFNEEGSVCELKKLFILPEARGLGIGEALTDQCINFAKDKGYQQCYLDTLTSMEAAVMLYLKMGFIRLDAPLEGTIHNACDVWMLKNL